MDVTFFENKPFFSNTHLQGETSSEDVNDDLLIYDVVPVHSSQNDVVWGKNQSELCYNIEADGTIKDVSNSENRDTVPLTMPLQNETRKENEMCARQGGIEFKGKVYKRKYPRQEDRAPDPKQSQEPEPMTDPENETQSGNSLSEP